MQLLGRVPVGDSRHSGLQSNLYATLRESGKLLPKMDLDSGEVRRIGDWPVAAGDGFDIWEGEYLGKEKVSLKVIRSIYVSPDTTRVRFLDTSVCCLIPLIIYAAFAP